MDDFLNYMTKNSLDLYRNTAHGTLLVRLHADNVGKQTVHTQSDQSACLGEPIALITEHRLFSCRQYTPRFDCNGEAAMELPSGDYTITVTAPGDLPSRTFVSVAEGKTSTVYAKLVAAEKKEQTLIDILKRNMVQYKDRHIRSLTLEEGQHLVLDENTDEYQSDLAQIELRSIRAVKDILGTPDKRL